MKVRSLASRSSLLLAGFAALGLTYAVQLPVFERGVRVISGLVCLVCGILQQ